MPLYFLLHDAAHSTRRSALPLPRRGAGGASSRAARLLRGPGPGGRRLRRALPHRPRRAAAGPAWPAAASPSTATSGDSSSARCCSTARRRSPRSSPHPTPCAALLAAGEDDAAPIRRAHYGTHDLVFGGGFYRPDAAGYNDVPDVAGSPTTWRPSMRRAGRVADLAGLRDFADEEERADELEFARRCCRPWPGCTGGAGGGANRGVRGAVKAARGTLLRSRTNLPQLHAGARRLQRRDVCVSERNATQSIPPSCHPTETNPQAMVRLRALSPARSRRRLDRAGRRSSATISHCKTRSRSCSAGRRWPRP